MQNPETPPTTPAELALNEARVLGPGGTPIHITFWRRLPMTQVIGVPAQAGKAIAERVRSAVEAAGFTYPRVRVKIEVGTRPAEVAPALLDLAIAVGILGAAGHLPARALTDRAFFGELGLDGSLRTGRGAFWALRRTTKVLVAPADATGVLRQVPGGRYLTFATLQELVERLPAAPPASVGEASPYPVHRPALGAPVLPLTRLPLGTCLYLVDPGASLSVLQQLRALLGAPSQTETEDILEAADLAGLSEPSGRPLRCPHHTISSPGLLAEWNLAVHGILYLDDAHLLSARTAEALTLLLRDPGAAKRVVIIGTEAHQLDAMVRRFGAHVALQATP